MEASTCSEARRALAVRDDGSRASARTPRDPPRGAAPQRVLGLPIRLAQDRLLQATRKGACRLRFHGEISAWEEWTLDARAPKISEPLDPTQRHPPPQTSRQARTPRRPRPRRRRATVPALPTPARLRDVGDVDAADARSRPLALVASDDDAIDERPTPRGAMIQSAGGGLFHPSSASVSLSSRRGPGAPPPSARSPPPGARSCPRFGAGSRAGQTDAAREHTSVLHSLSGVVAKEFVPRCNARFSARAAVEREVMELHAASEDFARGRFRSSSAFAGTRGRRWTS